MLSGGLLRKRTDSSVTDKCSFYLLGFSYGSFRTCLSGFARIAYSLQWWYLCNDNVGESSLMPHASASTYMLKVVTLNTWGVPFAPDKAARMRNIGIEITRRNDDIIALQEVWDTHDLTPILEGAQANGISHYHHYPAGLIGSGLVILSRYPIVDVEFLPFRLQGTAETIYRGDYIARKGIAFARIQTPLTMVDVYNIHTVAQYHPDEQDEYRAHRAAQHYEAARFVTRQSPDGNPLIVLGDFNARPDQLSYRIFQTLSGMTDCYTALRPDDKGLTHWTRWGHNQFPGGRRIDYVFVRYGAQTSLIPVKTHFAFVTDQNGDAGLYSVNGRATFSDHRGMVVEFEIRHNQKPANRSPKSSPTEVRAVMAELSATLHAGLIAAATRKHNHAWHLQMTAVAALPLVGLSRFLGGWYRRLVLPGAVLYALVRGLFAYITVPAEIHRLEAITDEIDTVLKTL